MSLDQIKLVSVAAIAIALGFGCYGIGSIVSDAIQYLSAKGAGNAQ